MKRHRCRILLFWLLVVLTFRGGKLHGEVSGSVRGQGDRWFSVAVPAAVEGEGAEAFLEVLRRDLLRSGWIRAVPVPVGELASSPASFYVEIHVTPGSSLKVEAYLKATGQSGALVAKAYDVRPEDLSKASHRFSDAVVEALSGRPGIASTRIAFVAREGEHPAIFSIGVDGRHERKLVAGAFPCFFPRHALNRDWIVYTAYPKGFPELWLLDVVSGRNHRISARPGLNTLGALSPDGRTIAATLSFEGNPEVYLLGLTGKIERRLTRHRGCDLSPVWSPDGKSLIFVSDRSGAPQIYLLSLEGEASPKQLSFPFNCGSYCSSPSWSPRGDWIAFTARRKGRFAILALRLADGEVVALTDGSASSEDPSWAPDGRHLVWVETGRRGKLLVIGDLFRPGEGRTLPLPPRSGLRTPSWQGGARR